MTQNTKTDTPFPMPWSVKGVSQKARQTAKQAAADAGMTMGLWLSQAIKRAAADPALFAQFAHSENMAAEPVIATPANEAVAVSGVQVAVPPAPSSAPDAALLNYLQKMDQKLSDLSDRLVSLEQVDDTMIANYEDPPSLTSVKNWPSQ